MTVPRNQRVQPSEAQVRKARGLLEQVPALAYDWSSEYGQAFLGCLDELTRKDVPLAWLADALDLDAPRLYATLNRYRKQRLGADAKA
jgi:hypothetical protein